MSSRQPDPGPSVPLAPGPRLVGRDGVLAELDDDLDRIAAGAFRVVLIEGAAGLGKTRLAAEVMARRSGRATCLYARSHRWGTTASLGPWVEALDRHLRSRSADDIRRLCGSSIDHLATVVASVESVAATVAGAPRRGRLLEGLVDVFEALSGERPVLVALDDIHLADTSSWEALRYLAARLPSARIGILATARRTDLHRHPIAAEVLKGLDDDGLLRRVDLPALGEDEIRHLAGAVIEAETGTDVGVIPRDLVSWLATRTLGQPLFIVGLVRALLAEDADLAAPRLERVPETLRERVSLDLQALDARHREVLELFAVIGRRTDPVQLREVGGWSAAAIGEVLENLCRSHLVTEDGRGPDLVYEVAHPIIQDTVYQDIGGARRRLLHRAVARSLLAAGRLGDAAVHFARSAERGDAEAVDALCRAMAQAEDRGLYREALAVLDALLDVLPPGDDRWLRVLDTMAWQAEWVLNHLAEGDAATAIAAMERIAPPVERAGDPVACATVESHRASFLSFGAGRLEEAERACRRAVRLFAAAGEEERALLSVNELAWIEGCKGDLRALAARAGATATAALACGHPRAAIQASGSQAYALGLSGRFDEAETAFATSIDLADTHADAYRVTWARAQRALVLGLAGRLHEATASAEAALDSDPLWAEALALEDLAHCDWLAGRLAAAASRIQQSAARRPVNGSLRRSWALALAARVHAEMDRPTRARSDLALATAAYAGREIMAWSSWPSWTEAVLMWQHAGDAAEAIETSARTAQRLLDVGALPYAVLVLGDLAEVAAEAGDRPALEHAATCARDIAERAAGELLPLVAGVALARRDLVAGRAEPAATAARSAAAGLGERGYALHQGAALEVVGRALEKIDRAGAVDALHRAGDVYRSSGASWRHQRVAARLTTLGSRGRRSAAALRGRWSLTAREREVARLAARGDTAREIGERLFIGRRTVESHLANVYAKLGVGSKRDLARRARELGLGDQRDP